MNLGVVSVSSEASLAGGGVKTAWQRSIRRAFRLKCPPTGRLLLWNDTPTDALPIRPAVFTLVSLSHTTDTEVPHPLGWQSRLCNMTHFKRWPSFTEPLATWRLISRVRRAVGGCSQVSSVCLYLSVDQSLRLPRPAFKKKRKILLHATESKRRFLFQLSCFMETNEWGWSCISWLL